MDGRGRRGPVGRGRGLFDSDEDEAPSQSPQAAAPPPTAPAVSEPTSRDLRQRYESDSDDALEEDVGGLSITSVVHSSASTTIGRGRGIAMGRGRDQESVPVTVPQVAVRPVEMPIVQQSLQTTTILRPAPQHPPMFTPIRSVAPQQQPTPFRTAAPLPSPIVAPSRFRSVAPPHAPQQQFPIIVPIEASFAEQIAPSVAGGSGDVGAEESQWSGGVGASGSSVAPSTKAPTKQQPPKRVKIEQHGNKGDIAQIATNYVRLNYKGGGRIFEYHVDFTPEIDATKMKRKVMHTLLGEGAVYSFDGTMLFLPKKDNGDILEFTGSHPVTSEPVKAVAKFVKEKEPSDLVQFFNILLKRVMITLQRIQLRRNYYDPSNVKTLAQHRLEIWPGWCIAVEEMEGGLMVCLDVSHRVLRTDTVLASFAVMRGATAKWQETFTDFVVGKIVLTRYNNTLYKIDDVLWEQTPSSTFTRRDVEVSFLKYYKEHHQVDITDLTQPMLLSRVKPRRGDLIQEDKLVALVPELCYITGLTDEERNNFTVMKDMGEHTRLTPHQRKVSLESFINEINGSSEATKLFSDWNLELEKGPLLMNGRLMTGATLNFGKREVVVGADFGREALASVYDPQRVEKYLFICTQRDANKAKQFVDTYILVCRQLGIPVMGNPVIFPIRGYQVNDFRKAIKDNITEQNGYQFLMCMMPQQRDDVYSLIKKMCVSELEIPSQCMLTKTLSNEKRFKSVVQRIALQINCKLGGALWSLKVPIQALIMFVGIDVAHDPKRKNPSVLGLVATLNNECTKYVSVTRIMKVHQETADSMQSAFIDVLKQYKIANGEYPARIIVWRDGGMADPRSFNQHEVKQVEKAIEEMCPLVKFSFVVIQKRISQRFFKTDRNGRNWENPAPGTVIDNTVTRFDEYDFYVVSQLVRQGTVSPTHYVVIADTAQTKPDLIQKFAYVCSFMYYNWPGTVRVPAMTQYAHKLAGLVGNNVRANPGKALDKTLYYL